MDMCGNRKEIATISEERVLYWRHQDIPIRLKRLKMVYANLIFQK